MHTPFCCVWEFEVSPGAQADFEQHYGPQGSWVALFREDPAYLETLLLHDESQPGRYLTVDRWQSAEAYRAFRERFAGPYEALDRLCERLTQRELRVGEFCEVNLSGGPSVASPSAPSGLETAAETDLLPLIHAVEKSLHEPAVRGDAALLDPPLHPHRPLRASRDPGKPMPTVTLTVGIFIFDKVEVLDFAGPYEVFTTASRVSARERPAQPVPFEVVTIARGAPAVQARAGLRVLPDHALHSHPALDLLIVPGGVVTAELARPELIAWIAGTARSARLTASVCTGAFLLAEAGLLDGRRATTHWEDIAELRARYPRLTVLEQQRWVDEGEVVTSAGISAGIGMSLHLVERLAGRELAVQTARQMEFEWAGSPLAVP